MVVAYGLILPRAVLEAPRAGCLNLHASALPRWRGAAPIARAIMAGDAMTAATIMRMDEGLDTGPVCLAEQVPIGLDTTAGELHDMLAERGARLMVQALAAVERGALACAPQPETGVTYAAKIDKGETGIDFTRPAARGAQPRARPLACSRRLVRRRRQGRAHQGPAHAHRARVGRSAARCSTARPPWPAARAPCELVELQRAGKRPMAAAEFLRGFPLPPGTQVGSRQ